MLAPLVLFASPASTTTGTGDGLCTMESASSHIDIKKNNSRVLLATSILLLVCYHSSFLSLLPLIWIQLGFANLWHWFANKRWFANQCHEFANTTGVCKKIDFPVTIHLVTLRVCIHRSRLVTSCLQTHASCLQTHGGCLQTRAGCLQTVLSVRGTSVR